MLRKVQKMVVSDPEIMRGTPVFKGTRVPVELVVEMTALGATVEEILAGYPRPLLQRPVHPRLHRRNRRRKVHSIGRISHALVANGA